MEQELKVVVNSFGKDTAGDYYKLLKAQREKLESEKAEILRTFRYATNPGSYQLAEIGGKLAFVNETLGAIEAVYMKRSDAE